MTSWTGFATTVTMMLACGCARGQFEGLEVRDGADGGPRDLDAMIAVSDAQTQCADGEVLSGDNCTQCTSITLEIATHSDHIAGWHSVRSAQSALGVCNAQRKHRLRAGRSAATKVIVKPRT